jgi:L-lactate dehydrogenase (cytochrome)
MAVSCRKYRLHLLSIKSDSLRSEAYASVENPEALHRLSAKVREAQHLRARETRPPFSDMVILQYFELWARRALSEVAWAYYRSAAGQERSNYTL